MQFFSTDANIFSKFFFVNRNFTKWDSKVAHNQPRPFYLTVQPRPQPTAQNWFFILWNLGTRHLVSYLWLYAYHVRSYGRSRGYHTTPFVPYPTFTLSVSKISKMNCELWSVFFDFLFDKIWCVMTRFMNFLIAKCNKTDIFWMIWCRFEIENLWPSIFIISYLRPGLRPLK